MTQKAERSGAGHQPPNLARLPQRLVAILERERRSNNRALRDVHALTLEERVTSGDAVRGLAMRHRDDTGFELACPENMSRFRDGDTLWLGDGQQIERGLAVVFRDYDPTTETIRIDVDRFLADPDRPLGPFEGELVLDRRELDLTDRVIGAVRALFSRTDLAAARDLLLGRADPKAAVVSIASAADAAEAGLDDTQTAAFVDACNRPFQLVQGPPGSGKTRLAAAIARAFARRDQNILVTAFTHRAVNNVLLAAVRDGLDAGGAVRVVKVGSFGQAAGLADVGIEPVRSPRRLRGLGTGPCIVGATTHAAINLTRGQFDLVLIDEAGQVSLPHACAVLPLGPRHVIVGDHRQLPPLVIGDHTDSLVNTSLFELLHACYGSHLLRYTYRMNRELCRAPSEWFYGGNLEAATANAERKLDLDGATDPLLAADPPVVIVPMSHAGARILAPAEAEIAATIVARAVASGVPPEEVAVLAPHRAQGTRIRALLRAKLPDLPVDRQPVVDTVERLQGGERDLIVLSLTASDPETVLSEAAFFFSPNRLNVSLTRARKKLIILMSPEILEAFPKDPIPLWGAELMRRLWRETPKVSFELP